MVRTFGIAAVVLLLLSFPVAATTGVTELDVSVCPEKVHVSPGETVTLKYKIKNVGDAAYGDDVMEQSDDLLFLEGWPEQWKIVERWNDGGEWVQRDSWVQERGWGWDYRLTTQTLWAGETLVPRVTFQVPEDAEGEYVIVASLDYEHGFENVTTTIVVEERSAWRFGAGLHGC